LEFGRAECSNMLLCLTARGVRSWDLFSLDVTWSVSISAHQIISDPKSSFMALLCNQPWAIRIFKPHSSNLDLCQVTLKAEDELRFGVFVPHSSSENESDDDKENWQMRSSLYCIGSRDKLFHFISTKHATTPTSVTQTSQRVTENLSSLMTPFGSHLISLVDRKQNLHDASISFLSVDKTGKDMVGKFLEIGTHVMPSLDLLCGPFLRSFLQEAGKEDKGHSENIKDSEMKSDNNDSDSDDELIERKKARLLMESSTANGDVLGSMELEAKMTKLKLCKVKDYDWLCKLK